MDRPEPPGGKFRRLGRVIGYVMLLALILGSLSPPAKAPSALPQADKVLHFAVYSLVSGWWFGFFPEVRWFVVVAGMLLLGYVLELLQGLTGYRDYSLLDMAANACGILVAAVLRELWLAVSRARQSGR